MSEFISINDIDKLRRTMTTPLYIMVAGGMAAGKTHVVSRYLSETIEIFDIDETMTDMGFVEYTDEQFSAAMDKITKQIDRHMRMFRSMVAMGTSSNISTAINRLYEAKRVGYKTVLLHIDASVEQSIKQNNERLAQGLRGVSKAEEYKIERTNVGAANTVATLRETELVDYFAHYVNIRNGELNG